MLDRSTSYRLMRWSSVAMLLSVIGGLLFVAGCGSSDATEDGVSGVAAGFQQVTDVATLFTPDDLDTIGFKTARSYKLEGLPSTTAAIFGFWRISSGDPIDFEIRFYESHSDAVEFGTAPAEEGSGADAVLDSSEASYKEGIKDRRMIIGKGPGGGGRSGTGPRYGNYAIYGNMVMLCAGAEIGQSLSRCEEIANALEDAVTQ